MIDNMKIFAADIDGTLLVKGEHMLPRTREAMIRLHNEGVLIGVASGRPLDQTIINKAKEWELGFEFDFAIGMNGGDLWMKETGVIEHFYQLPAEDIREILNFIWDLDINVIIYENAYAHVKGKRMDDFLIASQQRNNSFVEIVPKENMWQHATGKIETQMKHEVADQMWEAVRNHPSDHWLVVKTYENEELVTIEFMDPRIHKGIAVEEYVRRKGLSVDNVMAFGDLDNDIGMLKTAGWGVCLKNGSDTTKAVADAITEYPVEEDGVGRYLETYYFKK